MQAFSNRVHVRGQLGSRGPALACTPALHASRCPSARRTAPVRVPRQQQVCCSAAPPRTAEQAASTLQHEPPITQEPGQPKAGRTRVVVLGSGWGAVSFLKNLDPRAFGEDGQYELILISPRNYFLFTPLLPSAVSGTVEERSIVEPIRNLIHGKGTYYEAQCLDIDPQTRTLTCLKEYCEVCRARALSRSGPSPHTDADHTFTVQYDVLLLAVGAVNNTFGIKGVEQHCWFLKTIDEAHKLRVHLSKAIEHAGLPSTSPEERRRLLSFVVVGGGPTGCELAAELHDLVTEDVQRLFPHLKNEVSITLVETLDHLLNAYDRQIAEYAGKLFVREGIQLKLNTQVLAVEEGKLLVQSKGKAEETLDFGTCVWATGVGLHPLVKSLKSKLSLDAQTSPTGLVVDRFLRVKGWDGSIIALGDAAVTNQDKALEHAAQLFAGASISHDTQGRLSEAQVHELLRKAMREYPQMGELSRQLEDGAVTHQASGMWHGARKLSMYTKHIEKLQRGVNYEEFQELLADVDKMLRALPATAQVARQEGEYLASMFNSEKVTLLEGADAAGGAAGAAVETVAGDGTGSSPVALPRVELDTSVGPFHYTHLGSLAYLGMDRAVMQLPSIFPFRVLKGWLVGHAWRGMETFMQVSVRNQWMVLNDWVCTKIFGRNLSDV